MAENVVGSSIREFFEVGEFEKYRQSIKLIQDQDSFTDPAQDRKLNVILVHPQTGASMSVDLQIQFISEGLWKDHIVLVLRNTTQENLIQSLLSSSQSHLQEIIDTFPDIYYVTDSNGILIKVSPSVRCILGYEPAEVLGTPMLGYYERPELRNEIVAKVFSGKGQYVRVETALLHKNGHPIWFNTRARVLYDADGTPCGLEGLARDASAEKRIQDLLQARESELLQIKGALEEKVTEQTQELLQKERMTFQKNRHEQMGEMISSIAHQWRQPLNVLAIWVQHIESLYKDGALKSADMGMFSCKANGLIRSMSNTIEEFRSFFTPLTEADVFDLNRSVTGVLQLIGSSLEQVNISVSYKADPNVWVYGFSNEFGQVIINLLINAKECFLERKVSKPQLVISVERVCEDAVLTVCDNAGGIPVEVLEKLFDPYFTTKKSGTGIGLYMSKNIVERHMRGQITAFNRDQGACFEIRLPLSCGKVVSPTFNERVPVKEPPKRKKTFQHLRVLLVDDNEEARTAFSMILSKKGIAVDTAANPQEGWKRIHSFKPNLIISDLLMPGEDGYGLLRRLKSGECPVALCIPTIALSAHVQADEIQRAVNAGFDRYVTKPIDWPVLLDFMLELVPAPR